MTKLATTGIGHYGLDPKGYEPAALLQATVKYTQNLQEPGFLLTQSLMDYALLHDGHAQKNGSKGKYTDLLRAHDNSEAIAKQAVMEQILASAKYIGTQVGGNGFSMARTANDPVFAVLSASQENGIIATQSLNKAQDDLAKKSGIPKDKVAHDLGRDLLHNAAKAVQLADQVMEVRLNGKGAYQSRAEVVLNVAAGIADNDSKITKDQLAQRPNGLMHESLPVNAAVGKDIAAIINANQQARAAASRHVVATRAG